MYFNEYYNLIYNKYPLIEETKPSSQVNFDEQLYQGRADILQPVCCRVIQEEEKKERKPLHLFLFFLNHLQSALPSSISSPYRHITQITLGV